jgi:hypothetical protein
MPPKKTKEGAQITAREECKKKLSAKQKSDAGWLQPDPNIETRFNEKGEVLGVFALQNFSKKARVLGISGIIETKDHFEPCLEGLNTVTFTQGLTLRRSNGRDGDLIGFEEECKHNFCCRMAKATEVANLKVHSIWRREDERWGDIIYSSNGISAGAELLRPYDEAEDERNIKCAETSENVDEDSEGEIAIDEEDGEDEGDCGSNFDIDEVVESDESDDEDDDDDDDDEDADDDDDDDDDLLSVKAR